MHQAAQQAGTYRLLSSWRRINPIAHAHFQEQVSFYGLQLPTLRASFLNLLYRANSRIRSSTTGSMAVASAWDLSQGW